MAAAMDGGGQVTFPKLVGIQTETEAARKGEGEVIEAWKVCCVDR